MTDSPSTELREKLDKLGIEHLDSDLPNNKQTRWNKGAGGWGACYVEITHGSILPADSIIDNCTLRIYDCTPDQAIAATLGDGWDDKPFVEYAEHVAKEIHGEAFALLEGCDEPDFSAIDAICAVCEDVNKIADRWRRGESQDEFTAPRSATHGTLTAEQVRETIRKYAEDDSCYIFEVYGEMCGPIADELNNMLGSETCKIESVLQRDYGGEGSDTYEFALSCGHSVEWLDPEPPRHCPNCGRKVVEQ